MPSEVLQEKEWVPPRLRHLREAYTVYRVRSCKANQAGVGQVIYCERGNPAAGYGSVLVSTTRRRTLPESKSFGVAVG